MARLFIGTSGYSYEHWEKGVFYPKVLEKGKQLEYYSLIFQSVEINASFYQLPTTQTFESWYNRTHDDFIFALKASRYLTHLKRLKNCQVAWQLFLNRAKTLEEKLGPILFQLPPNYQEDLKVLKKFIDLIVPKQKKKNKQRFVFEFRHDSWFINELYDLLKKKNIALCWADSPDYPSEEKLTADFAYIRLHGSKSLYGSDYNDYELDIWAKKAEDLLKQNKDVYIYFNNDAGGYAAKNAKTLLDLTSQ